MKEENRVRSERIKCIWDCERGNWTVFKFKNIHEMPLSMYRHAAISKNGLTHTHTHSHTRRHKQSCTGALFWFFYKFHLVLCDTSQWVGSSICCFRANQKRKSGKNKNKNITWANSDKRKNSEKRQMKNFWKQSKYFNLSTEEYHMKRKIHWELSSDVTYDKNNQYQVIIKEKTYFSF